MAYKAPQDHNRVTRSVRLDRDILEEIERRAKFGRRSTQKELELLIETAVNQPLPDCASCLASRVEKPAEITPEKTAVIQEKPKRPFWSFWWLFNRNPKILSFAIPF